MDITSSPSTCSINDCDAPVFSRGWCSKHYTRWQRHGDPLVTLRQPPQTAGESKRCPRCGNTKPMDEFDRRPNGRPKGYCRSCESLYQEDRAGLAEGREQHRRARSKWNSSNHGYFLNYRYGITVEQYDAMLASQGGACAICGAPEPGGKAIVWCVDHCHNSNRVRGLLCGPCNRGLGQFRDDPARLRAAADYIEQST